MTFGDFNARSARKLDHLEDQGANDHITEDIYEHDGFNLPTNNKDTEKNNYGEELLKLCKNYNVLVLNGRLDGDSRGEITCIANDGASTTDYGIVNTRLFDKINSFEIIQRVESDHFPICCTQRRSHGLPLDPMDSNVHFQLLARFKYSNRGEEAFLENIQKEETDTKLNSLSELSRVTNKHIIDLVVERLTAILQKSASNFRTKSFSGRGRKQPFWYDKDCDNAKKEKYRWLNIFRVTNDKAILLKFKAARNKFRAILTVKDSNTLI